MTQKQIKALIAMAEEDLKAAEATHAKLEADTNIVCYREEKLAASARLIQDIFDHIQELKSQLK